MSTLIVPQRAQYRVQRIEPSAKWVPLRLGEMWEFRELLAFLVWRDFKVRYKQTAIGALWAILQPLFTMAVFTVFLGKLAKVPSDGVPYPLFSYAGLIPWMFFATGLAGAANSMVSNANLIKKVYFPRLTVPVASVVCGLVDMAWAFSVMLLMLAIYRFPPPAHIFWLPFFVLMALISCLGVGLWLSALNVEYRDVRHSLPFLVQFWMFATPVAYPSSMVPEPWRTLFGLNPMAGVVEGFRWAILGTSPAPGPMVAVSFFVAILLLVGGAFYFRRMEKTFADIV